MNEYPVVALATSNRRFYWLSAHLSQLDHVKRVNEVVLCFFMIEKETMDVNIEEICSIPGVDMVQFDLIIP